MGKIYKNTSGVGNYLKKLNKNFKEEKQDMIQDILWKTFIGNSTSIDELDLSARTKNNLKYLGLLTVGEVGAFFDGKSCKKWMFSMSLQSKIKSEIERLMR